jgi:cyclophilin family peptidyl-prolyl cis-trans isomerase/HEAT repeat protein
VDAEDSRPASGPALATLVDALELDDPFLRRVAVRALGRLESPALSATIAAHLADPEPDVRGGAAEALAQSVHGQDGSAVLPWLVDRIAGESDAEVRGTLARALGGLQLGETDRRDVEGALVSLGGSAREEPAETLIGVAMGFESLTRSYAGSGMGRPAADLLTQLMAYRPGGAGDDVQAGQIRALAATALGRARRLSLELIGRALDDPRPEPRRAVLDYLNAAPPSARDALVRRALADSSARVATAAVRYLATLTRTDPRCEQLIASAAADVSPAIRIPALEALATPCPTVGPQRAALIAAASEIDEPDAPWQPPAQALRSLARLDPERAGRLLPRYVEHESPFVRAHAARVASVVQNVATLFTLGVDPSPNVRNEAVQGLFAVDGHGMDDFLLEELDGDDPQLLITISDLLEGAPDRPRVAAAVLATLERISRAERETWRDPRLALLRRIAELGDESMAPRLIPFLGDYDALVAAAVVDVLETWTGGEYVAQPSPLPRAPVPTLTELRALETSTLRLHMSGGRTMTIELLADQAPTNVARVVRLARSGYYDGLTFHRWAPNFVIQGGSPGANEYQGDGPYTRDEVGGLPHWRGTVGISTRGRDTGDGQLFINLVDNPGLDHEYTVIGRLVDGYDVLDSILEGSVIERAEVVSGR